MRRTKLVVPMPIAEAPVPVRPRLAGSASPYADIHAAECAAGTQASACVFHPLTAPINRNVFDLPQLEAATRQPQAESRSLSQPH